MLIRRSRSDSAGEPADEDDLATEPEDDATDDEQPQSRLGRWLRPRKKDPDYGPDYAVTIATLPDLAQFPEDGHVHPEIIRSWLALQNFGEAMLLVSWYRRHPAGYLMISWTGDWDDEVRAEHPDVPSLCNLWVDDEHADAEIDAKLVDAALVIVQRQGRKQVLTTVDLEDKPARRMYRALGFDDTKMRTIDAYVYRDAEGRKRRGRHRNAVLLKTFGEDD